jgi:transcriptional regulator with XRE-family HTH domain
MHKSITSDKYRLLISWLKDVRLENGLSMRDLADRINEPHSFVGKIETLERRLDVYEYVIYCEALGVDPKKGLGQLISKNN